MIVTHIEHGTEHCPACFNYTVVTGGSADGGDVCAYQLCAECGEHRERLAHFDKPVSEGELRALVEGAF